MSIESSSNTTFTLLILPSLPRPLIVDLDLPPGAGYSPLLCGGREVAAIEYQVNDVMLCVYIYGKCPRSEFRG